MRRLCILLVAACALSALPAFASKKTRGAGCEYVVMASYDVKVGDILEIRLGQTPLKARVLSVSEYATKETASSQYEIIS